MPDKKRLKPQKVNQGNKVTVKAKTTPPDILEYFAFSFLFLKTPYHVEDWCDADKIALVKHLAKLCTLQWNQIYSTQRHGFGSEKISQESIRPTLPPHITEELSLNAMRFSGLKPMIGYRDENIFYVLFLDHNFSVYSH